jgi:hypothetical protein
MQTKALMRAWLLLAALLPCVFAMAADLGPELLPTGNMEQDAGLTSSNSGSATLPRVNEQSRADKHGGAASRHLVIARETTSEWPGAITDFYATQAGKTYEVRFWYKVLKGGFTVLVRNGADNDNLTPQPSLIGGPRYDMTGQFLVWNEYAGTYTEQRGGNQAYLRFIIASAGETEFFLDDVSVREVDISAAAALRRWRALCPGRSLVCWQKSPWGNLDAVQFPPEALRECQAMALTMGQKEYESASFVLTNLSAAELPVTVSVRSSRLAVTLRQARWVTEHDGARGNDALPLLEGPVVIPSGESREVWLTVQTGGRERPQGEKAGDYQATVDLKAPGVPPATVPLRVKVYPVALPDEKPLYTHYWDYLVPQWQGPELTAACVADLRAHYANVGVMHPWSVRMQFDAAGQLKQDFTDLDVALDAYRQLAPRILLINLLSEVYLEKQEGFMTEAWQARFRGWLQGLVKHLAEQGFGYDKIVIYPYDETIGPNVAAVARLIKETDPKLRVYVNAIGQTEAQVRAIAPFMDVWCPYLYDYLGLPPYDRPAALRALAARLLRKDDRFFWTYSNPLSNQPKLAPPYRDYRLVPWRAWTLGMGGCGYWIYSYKTHWNSYQHEDGPNWAVVYLANAPDAPPGLSPKELVVPSKRWEATREGVEDYCYLYMLRQAITAAEQRKAASQALLTARETLSDLPAAVLREDSNATLADDAKARIIAAIAHLNSPSARGQ